MPKITFLATGEVYEAAEGTPFLEVCEANNAPHDFGCTVGSCGTCRLVLEQGADNVQPPTEEELDTLYMVTTEEGARLGCQLIVSGDISVRPATDRDGY